MPTSVISRPPRPPKPHAGADEEDEEVFITRKRLCRRWSVSFMTIVRREQAGILHPVRFGSRALRYKLSEVLAVEKAAGVVEEPAEA